MLNDDDDDEVRVTFDESSTIPMVEFSFEIPLEMLNF